MAGFSVLLAPYKKFSVWTAEDQPKSTYDNGDMAALSDRKTANEEHLNK